MKRDDKTPDPQEIVSLATKLLRPFLAKATARQVGYGSPVALVGVAWQTDAAWLKVVCVALAALSLASVLGLDLWHHTRDAKPRRCRYTKPDEPHRHTHGGHKR